MPKPTDAWQQTWWHYRTLYFHDYRSSGNTAQGSLLILIIRLFLCLSRRWQREKERGREWQQWGSKHKRQEAVREKETKTGRAINPKTSLSTPHCPGPECAFVTAACSQPQSRPVDDNVPGWASLPTPWHDRQRESKSVNGVTANALTIPAIHGEGRWRRGGCGKRPAPTAVSAVLLGFFLLFFVTRQQHPFISP